MRTLLIDDEYKFAHSSKQRVMGILCTVNGAIDTTNNYNDDIIAVMI